MAWFETWFFNSRKSKTEQSNTTELQKINEVIVQEEIPSKPLSIPTLIKDKSNSFVSEQSSMPTLPAKTGRSSLDENFNGLGTPLNQLASDFPLEYLGVLEMLATFDSDISYAVDNICTIANTEHDITFDSSVSEKQAADMQRHLMDVRDSWYTYSSGADSLSRDLFAQLVINGCISAEAYPNEKMNGIQQIVKVSPKNIRFTLDMNQNYIPQQRITNTMFQTQNSMLGLKQLNPWNPEGAEYLTPVLVYSNSNDSISSAIGPSGTNIS